MYVQKEEKKRKHNEESVEDGYRLSYELIGILLVGP